MTTFDSTKASLNDLLREIKDGKIQLPDFQRGWVWDDDHIRDLLVSIARSFPIGAVMLLEAGGEVRFETRPVEGLEDKIPEDRAPEKLILDGQQRLTTLTQALMLDEPVHTRTAKGKRIKRHYYFDIRKAEDAPQALDEAVVAVNENRQLRSDFGRKVDLDLSTTELECQQLYFPCNQVMSSDDWEATLHRVAPDQFGTYMAFRGEVLAAFRSYQLPVIQLRKETSKEAVCLVFEKVNTGGVQLSVFELITASYAADGYNLRDDWFGSEVRKVDSRKERLEKDALLEGTEATEFLQAISLLHTHELRKADVDAGKTGKQVRPVSAKRADVLQLPLDAWRQWADHLEAGFRNVARFLRKECFYSRRELPYSTQLVPLAAVLTRLHDRWLEPRIYDKLARWFWSGALGELYGGAVETRMANDYEELLRWFEDDDAVPRTVRDANSSRNASIRCAQDSAPPTKASTCWSCAKDRRTGSGRPASRSWTRTRSPSTSTTSFHVFGAKSRASKERSMTASSIRRPSPTRPTARSAATRLHDTCPGSKGKSRSDLATPRWMSCSPAMHLPPTCSGRTRSTTLWRIAAGVCADWSRRRWGRPSYR